MNNDEHQPHQHGAAGQWPQGFVPGPTHKELMGEKLRQQAQETLAAVEREIANNPDKESFDYKKFANLYWKKDTDRGLNGDEPESVADAYRQEYYLIFRDVRTIESFARAREALDAESGN